MVVCVGLNFGRLSGSGSLALLVPLVLAVVCGCGVDLVVWGAGPSFVAFVVACYWCFGVWWLCGCCLVWVASLFCGFMLSCAFQVCFVGGVWVWWFCCVFVGAYWLTVLGMWLAGGLACCCSLVFYAAAFLLRLLVVLRVCASCSGDSWLVVVFCRFWFVLRWDVDFTVVCSMAGFMVGRFGI